MAKDKAAHYSAGKLGLDQFDWQVLVEDALVLNYGEFKYERNNWRKGSDFHEMFGSAMRHLTMWWLGENTDPESGLPHLSHARINLMFLRNWQLNGVGNDDREGINGLTGDSYVIGDDDTDEFDEEIADHYRKWLTDTIDIAKIQRAQREAK